MAVQSGRWISILVATVGVAVVAVLLPPSGPATSDGGDGYGAAAIDYQSRLPVGGMLRVVGPIGSMTLRDIESTIDRARGRVSVVSVRSLGGIDVTAVELARFFDTIGADLVLDDNAICASACVILVAAMSEGHRHLAPGAWLFVHPESLALPETQPSGGAAAQGFGNAADEPEDSMDRWVEKISKNWLSFLQGCKLQPLSQRGGLAMTWAEVEQVDKDPSSLDCDRIAYRDIEWLRGKMTSDLRLSENTL